MIKDLSYATFNCLSPFYLGINKINGYTEESNGNKYFMLVHSDESKDMIKSMKNFETKSDNYDKK